VIRVSQTHDGLICPCLTCVYCGEVITRHQDGVAAFEPERTQVEGADAPLYVLHKKGKCRDAYRRIIRHRGDRASSLEVFPLELLPVLIGLNLGMTAKDFERVRETAQMETVGKSKGTRR
jgi:hypothetical protein